MDTIKLKMLAGVSITRNDYKESITESIGNRNISKIINSLINILDNKADQTKNREDKGFYHNTASELEDILVLVKSGKQNKASRLFKELSPKIMEFVYSNLDESKSSIINDYFTSINERYDSVDELEDSINNNFGYENDDSDDEESDMIQCPFCDFENIMSKSDFYEHCIEEHIEEDEQEENQRFALDFTFEEAEDATVWDKTEDKDESPSPYPEDNDKIEVPKEILDSLLKEIKELQTESDNLLVSDFKTAEFYNDCANAMIDVYNYLNKKSEYGIKMAQICITKYMSPIIQKFPAEVYNFIIKGGADTKFKSTNSLVNLFKDIKSNK